MPDFTNPRDLVKYIKKIGTEAIQQKNSETQRTMIDTGKRHVQEDVYDVYVSDPNNPLSYERTGKLKESWEITPTSDGISMVNTREDEETGKDIVDTIEYGRNYDYPFPYMNTPRPFVENAAKDLASGNELKNAVKSDLKKSGLNVE